MKVTAGLEPAIFGLAGRRLTGLATSPGKIFRSCAPGGASTDGLPGRESNPQPGD